MTKHLSTLFKNLKIFNWICLHYNFKFHKHKIQEIKNKFFISLLNEKIKNIILNFWLFKLYKQFEN